MSALLLAAVLSLAGTPEPESLTLPADEAPESSPTPVLRAEGPAPLGTVRPAAEQKPSFRLPEVVVTGEGEALVSARREVTLPASTTKHLKQVAPAERVPLVLPSLVSGEKGVPSLQRTLGRRHAVELYGGAHLYNPADAAGETASYLLSHQTERHAGIRVGQSLAHFNYLADFRRGFRDGWLEDGVRAPWLDPGTGRLSHPATRQRRRLRLSENELALSVGVPLESVREARGQAGWKEQVLRLAYDANPDARLVKRRIGGGAAWQALGTRLSGFAGRARFDWTRLAEPPMAGSFGLPHEVSEQRGELDLRWSYPASRFYQTPWKEKDEANLRVSVAYSTVDHLLAPEPGWLPRAVPSGSGVVRPNGQIESTQSVLAVRGEAEERIPGDAGTELAMGLRAFAVLGFKNLAMLLPVLRGTYTFGTAVSLYGAFEPEVAADLFREEVFERDAIRAYHEAPAPHRSLSARAGVKFRVGDSFRADLGAFGERRSGVTLWDNPFFTDAQTYHERRYAARNVYHPWLRAGAQATFELTLAARLMQFVRYRFTRTRFEDARLGYRTTHAPTSDAELGLRYEPAEGEPWKFEGTVRFADSVFHTLERPARSDGSVDLSEPDAAPPHATLTYSVSRFVTDWAQLALEGEHMLYRSYGEYYPSLRGYHRPHFRVGVTGTIRF